ncbi:hypothetical protein OG949_23435 [Streptomyces scopuliridis]|uniref:hypothetical protein n=1 Tax=Streptomyces scopuliridis TaxID=452529 RepID=UPI002DDAC382|nr:hypothetical protein [Streptomyces scopuliridis]WSB35503.1 hypothetical protein OG949_23435 [Streptomyces scopuliridis]
MVEGKMYRARALRREQGWQVEVPDIGNVWVNNLNVASEAARELIAAQTGCGAASIHIQVAALLDEDLQKATKSAIQAVLDARRAQEKAAASYRQVARKLKDSGITGGDIAIVLGVSPQRVSQLLKE